MKLSIYIPTLGRVGWEKQVTLRRLLKHCSYEPIIVCPTEEQRFHKRYAPSVIVSPVEGIGNKRQWILENSKADIIVMVDDDTRFQYRPNPSSTKLEQCTQLDPLMKAIKDCVSDGFVHGGIGPRFGNNRKDLKGNRSGTLVNGNLIVDCERVNNFHFVYRKAVVDIGARFDALPVMEDFHFTLTLLTRGFPNRVIHNYVWNQGPSGAPGGCSLFRTPEIQEQGAIGLQKAFPDFVRVVNKKSKESSTFWQGFKERKDVVVQWLKAARAGGIDI